MEQRRFDDIKKYNCDNKNLIITIIILSLIILLSIATIFHLSKKNKDKNEIEKENEPKDKKIKNNIVPQISQEYEQNMKQKIDTNNKGNNNKEEVKSFKERLKNMKFDFKKNERLISIVVVLFLILLVFIGTNSKFLEKENNKEIKAIASETIEKENELKHTDIALNEIVLTIDGEPITYEKYRYYCDSLKKDIDNGNESYWFEDDTTILTDDKSNQIAKVNAHQSKMDLELEVIEKLKEIVVINKLAVEYKIEVTQEELDTKLQSIIDSVGEDEFNKVLIENNISRSLYVDILKSTMQEEKLLKVLFYDEIKAKMEEMDIARVKHILITYNDEIITSGDITQEMENAIIENITQNQTGIIINDAIVYEEQDENSTNLGELKVDDIITINNISEDSIWCTISYNNKDAFVKMEFVKLNEETIEDEETIMVAKELNEDDIVVKQLTKQEAYDLSKEILTKLDNGEDFDVLMQQYTEDASMIDNPNGYYIVRTKDMKETIIETTAFELEENQYSKIIETNLGFHIIYKCPLEESYIKDHILDYANDEIWLKYDNLLEQKTIGYEYIIGENYINAFTNVFYDSYEKYQKIKSDNE